MTMRATPDQPNPWAALSALCIGFFMILMDTTIVNVAIPRMMGDLHASLNGISWVNSVYLLTFAVPLLLTGRLGDRLGRKRVFVTGMAIFTLASLGCGLSTTLGMLVAARAVQGLGAAAMAPQSMAFITHLFPPDRRGAALGAWGAVAGAATTVGPMLGGVLVDRAGWQPIFLVNVPIGLAGLVLTAFLVPGGQPRRTHRLDVAGTVLSSLGLLMVVFGIQNGEQYHWGRVFGPISVWAVLGAGVVLLAAFVGWQRNTAEPLLPLALFRHRNFSTASVAGLCIGFALTGMYLPVAVYLQQGLRYSPLHAGLTTVPIALSAGVVGFFAGRLSDRVSGRYVVATGFGVFALAIGMIATVATPRANGWVLAAVMLLAGFGTGSVFAPLANVATGGLPLELIGAASGVYNTARQVGSVVGSAAVSVLLQSRLAARGGGAAGLAGAVRVTVLLPVAVLVVGMLACTRMTDPVRNGRRGGPTGPTGSTGPTARPRPAADRTRSLAAVAGTSESGTGRPRRPAL